jgi:hypothetical protein
MVNPAKIHILASCLRGKSTDHLTRQSYDTQAKYSCPIHSTESIGFLPVAGPSVGRGEVGGRGYSLRFFFPLTLEVTSWPCGQPIRLSRWKLGFNSGRSNIRILNNKCYFLKEVNTIHYIEATF